MGLLSRCSRSLSALLAAGLWVGIPGGLLGSALAAAPARADDAIAGTEAEAQAMALYAQGEEHYQAGRIEEALIAFKEAYRLLPAPGLLVNIGQCFRQLGDHANAVRAFERYLQEDPEAENRAEVEELIAAERALLPKPAAAPAAAKPAAEDDGELFESPILWVAVGGAALALALGGAITVAVVAAQPQPLPVSGSLGTFDLR